MNINNYIKGVLRNVSSALRYENVTYLEGYYIPETPFKGLHVSTAGDVTILGVDDVEITLTLTPGCWPYGGIGIAEASTTSTGLVALF